MIHRVDREYVLTADEAKEAIWHYLKKMDKPVPVNAGGLEVKWNAPGDVFVKFGENINDQ